MKPLVFVGSGIVIGVALAACFPEATEVECAGMPKPTCCNSCSGSRGSDPACRNGQWICSQGSVSADFCDAGVDSFCLPPLPNDGGSSLRVCADSDAGLCVGCEPGEICFTQLTCDPFSGAASCTPGASPGHADDRCHRVCDKGTCGAGEQCVTEVFFGCAGFGTVHPICCSGPGCP